MAFTLRAFTTRRPRKEKAFALLLRPLLDASRPSGHADGRNERDDVERHVAAQGAPAGADREQHRAGGREGGTAQRPGAVGPAVHLPPVPALGGPVDEGEGRGEHHARARRVGELHEAQRQEAPGAVLVGVREEAVDGEEAVGEVGHKEAEEENVEETSRRRTKSGPKWSSRRQTSW